MHYGCYALWITLHGELGQNMNVILMCHKHYLLYIARFNVLTLHTVITACITRYECIMTR